VYIGATPIRVWMYLHTYIVALNKYGQQANKPQRSKVGTIMVNKSDPEKGNRPRC